MKHLFEYICEGHVRVPMEDIVGDQTNYEISNLQGARYMSASETARHMLGFDIVDRDPAIMRLDIHREDHHAVYLEEGRVDDAASRERSGTTLNGWFEANLQYPDAQYPRYVDYSIYFTWNRKN